MAFCESHCQRQQRRRLTTASANDDDHSDRTLFSQSEPVEPLEITMITTSHCPGGSLLDDAPEEELSPTTTSQRSSSSPTSITATTTTTTSRRRPLPVSSRRPRARHSSSSSWWSSGHLSTIASTLLLLTLTTATITTTVLANSVLNAAGDAKQEFGGGISHHASHQSSSSAAAASASAAAPSAIGIGVVTGGSSLASSSVSSSSSSSSSAEAAAASSAVISSDGSSSSSSSGKALAPAGSTPRRPRYRTLYACEGSSLEIACEEGTHINLIRANFGRFSISVCNEHGNVEWSVDCMSRRSFKVIEERCAGRSKCSLEATVASLGEDACPRVHKYLEVHFNCTAPGFRPSSPAVAGSLDSISSSSSDNHHHPDMIMGPSSGNPRSPSHHNPYQQHHHNHNHHHSTIPPLMLFPEPPSAPQPSSSASSGTTSSSPLQRPFLDFGVNGDKEKEEMENDNNNNNNNNGNHHGSEAGTLIGPHFGHHEPPVVVRPPQPSPQDFSNNNNNNNNGDDDSEDNGGGDEDDDEDQEKPISPYGSDREDSQPDNNNNHNHNNHHHKEQQPVIVVEPSMEPTAKPPKPPKDFPLGNDYNNHHQTFTSSPLNPADPSHGLLDPNSSSNENGIPVETATYVVMPPLDTLLYDHCHPMYAKGLNWNWTAAGQVAMQPCPEGAEGTSRWACTTDAGGVPTWTPALPDMSNCSSLWVTHLVGRLRSHKDSMFTMAEELAKGAKGKKMYSGDLIRAADIVKQLVSRLETYLEESLKEEDQERRANVIKELLNSVLNVASNLLEEIQMESWHELTAQDQRLAIGSMTGALESVATMLADVRSQPNYNYVRTHNNILVSVHVHSLAALEHGLRLPLVLSTGSSSQHNEIPSPTLGDSAPTEVSAYLPYEALVEHANENGQVKIVFMIYRRLAGLLKPRHLSASYEAQNLQTQPTGSPQAERSFMNSDREEPPVFVNPYQTANGRHNYRAAAQSGFSGQVPSSSSSSAVTIVNSDVVGLIIASDHHQISSGGSGRRASVYDRLSTPLSAPLELTLRHLTVDNVTNGRCAFWDIKRADWSTAGCQTVTSNRSHTVCRCNHLTNFAVLMDVANVPLSSGDEYALKMITRVGCAVSIVALTLTLITLSVYRSLKSIRNSIHKHLCACLLVAETIFLLGIDETRVKLLCGLIAIALHYFFLAAFLWMFFEGLQLYTMLVTVFDSHRPHRLTAYTLVAYGAPALLVIVAALVDPLSYGTSDHCWLRADNHFVWSFLGPALAVLLANALFLALAMSVMCRHGGSGSGSGSGSGMISASSAFAVHQKAMAQQQQSQLKVYPSPLTSSPSYSIAEHSRYTSIRVWVRTSFALVVVLGLTWTFGVLYLSTRSNLVMAYLFTVLNSLQGLFIFVACCLLNEKVRGEYRTTLARGARRCFFLRPFEGVFLGSSSGQGGISSSLAAGGFTTKSSTDSSTRSASMMVRDGMPHHHLMMGANGLHHPQLQQQQHHLSQQHLYMQQPAASYLGARNATGGGPATRTSLLYLNELLGGVKGGGNGSQLQSETATAASTPTADQPLIGGGSSQLMGGGQGGQSMTPSQHLSQAQSTIGLDQQQQQHHNLNALQQSQLSAALAGLSQITLPGMTANGDDVSNSDYGCRRLTQMIEHIYECIDEDPYVAKLLLPAIERSLTNHQVRTAQQQQQQQQSRINSNQNGQPLPSQILATLGRQSHRDISQHMRLQPNSSYLSSPGGHHQQQQQQHHTLQHGAINSMHLPAIVRDNTLNGKMLHQQQQQNGFAGHHQHHQQQQQTVALLDGDTVRCCTLTDHKLCDHGSSGGHHQQQQHSHSEMMMNGGGGGTGTLTAAHHMMKMAAAGGRHHLASEC